MRRMNESDGAALRSSLAAATPSRQHYALQSTTFNVQPSTQHSTGRLIAASLLEVLLAGGSTSRRDA